MTDFLNKTRTVARKTWAVITCHRAFYAGLTLAHLNGCWMTDYPLLYAPMAALYAGLWVRG
jgi:hypothetical protein